MYRSTRRLPCFLIVGLIASLAVLSVLSCASRSALRVENLGTAAAKGQYLKAIQKIRKAEPLYGNLNRFLFYFDQGVLFHYAEEFDSSLVFLQKAEKVLDDLFARSITNEAASILTNDNLRPYRSRRYERILLHQLMSLDYLAKGQLDESLVESRKVQMVVDAFKGKDGDNEKYSDDGMSQYFTALVYGAQQMPDDALISLYKSVAAYEAGSVPLPDDVRDLAYHALTQGGRESDVAALKLSSSTPAEKVPGLDPRQSEIILVGYAGKGPVLDELVMWGDYIADGLLVLHYRDPAKQTEVTLTLPAPPLPDLEAEKRGEKGARKKVASGTTYFVKFAIPSPVRRPSQTASFSANVDQQGDIQSTELSNTDLLLSKDLEDNRNRTIARTVIRVVLRTIAAQAAKERMQTSNAGANLLLNLGTDVLTAQMEKADARLCFLMPKSWHVVRLPVQPGTHRVEAAARTASGGEVGRRTWEAVKVGAGEKKFIFYPSLQ